MELRHLRYFLAVAEEAHFTRAAARLGIQQPPLSQQIRALETELAAQLFVRNPRGVALTEAGRALQGEARAILAQVEHAVAATRRIARGEQGRIVVGLTSSAPFVPFVPRVIRAFRDSTPLVSLVLEETGTGEMLAAMRGELVDVAFIRSPVPDPAGLVVDPLLEEEMVVALPAGHDLAPAAKGAATPRCRWRPLPGRASSSTGGMSGRGSTTRSSPPVTGPASARSSARRRRASSRRSTWWRPG